MLELSKIIDNFLRYWRSSRWFPFVDTGSSKKCIDYIFNVSLQHCFLNLQIRVFSQVFLLTNGYRIHPFSVYERPIARIRHNSDGVLFNKINHFHGLRFLAQKQNFHAQAPRVLKTTVLLFWAWIKANYCHLHLTNVRTIKAMTLNQVPNDGANKGNKLSIGTWNIRNIKGKKRKWYGKL